MDPIKTTAKKSEDRFQFISSMIKGISALYRKSGLCIPRNETAQPRSQSYIEVSVSNLYIPRIGLPIWLQQKRVTGHGNI